MRKNARIIVWELHFCRSDDAVYIISNSDKSSITVISHLRKKSRTVTNFGLDAVYSRLYSVSRLQFDETSTPSKVSSIYGLCDRNVMDEFIPNPHVDDKLSIFQIVTYSQQQRSIIKMYSRVDRSA